MPIRKRPCGTKRRSPVTLHSSSSSEKNYRGFNRDLERGHFLRWLTYIDFGARQSHHIKTRHSETGRWLLNSTEYHSWVGNPGQTLYCTGLPGVGKTVLTSIVVEDLELRFGTTENVGIAYFYLDSQYPAEQSPEGLLLSLVKQLAQRKQTMIQSIEDSFSDHHLHLRPDWLDILKMLDLTVREFSRVFLVVDALEDCVSACRKAF